MNGAAEFLVRHGEAIVFAAVFAEQIGLPVPAIPVLLAAGALAGAGKMSLAGAVLLSLVACFAGDLIWYGLGRSRGRHALNLLLGLSHIESEYEFHVLYSDSKARKVVSRAGGLHRLVADALLLEQREERRVVRDRDGAHRVRLSGVCAAVHRSSAYVKDGRRSAADGQRRPL